MKPFMLFLAVVICLTDALTAQNIATITPRKPRLTDTITVVYDTRPTAARIVEPPMAKVLLWRSFDQEEETLELPMVKSGDIWKTRFTLKDSVTLCLLQFIVGIETDNNRGKGWDFIVYGEDGVPVRDARYYRGDMLCRGGYRGFKREERRAEGIREFTLERRQYADNWLAAIQQWMFMLEDSTERVKSQVRRELDELYPKLREDERAMSYFVPYFERTGQRERAETIRKECVAKHPYGFIARQQRQELILSEKDAVKRTELITAYRADFPDDTRTNEYFSKMLVDALIEAKRYDDAVDLLGRMDKPDVSPINNIAWECFEKGENVEKAVAWAKKGIDIHRSRVALVRPPSVPAGEWSDPGDYSLGLFLDTYGFGLDKLGKRGEALIAYKEAHEKTEGQEPEINQRLVESYLAAGQYDDAVGTGLACIRRSASNDTLLKHLKDAYARQKGSVEGFDEMVHTAREEGRRELLAEMMANRINKPAIDFTLKDLQGRSVRLSDLKGKVVVLDFWATWCGPCVASFPSLQQVFDAYKNNDDVRIYAINTWEGKKGKEREYLVRRFMTSHGYTFPVLFDKRIVDRYGVTGIPEKFVIDRDGIVQFKSGGFLGSEKMVNELTSQIDLLLGDGFNTGTKK